MAHKHIPVMLAECVEALRIKPGGIYLDGTLGGGGHSEEILRRLQTGRLIAIDRDERAIKNAELRFARRQEDFIAVKSNFSELDKVLNSLGIETVDGMLFDLGVSSPQLDEPCRGFSYMSDAPLDMRMDESAALDAHTIVNTWTENDLKRIFYDYGEERYSPRIASRIVSRREKKAIETTFELVDIIKSAMPPEALREKQHPAKRCFQAIRIAVNGELEAVSEMMEKAAVRLRPEGRLAVISFHSGEDRIVKNAIRAREKGCTCPRDFPACVCGFKQTLKSVTKKPITPSEAELRENPRARSAKLRVAERV